MRATIKEVAELAKVSTATVSNVLTGRKPVSDELKDKVNEAIRQLNYKPNFAARTLKTNQSHLIGVIVPDIMNPFFAEVLSVAAKTASARGFQVLMYSTGEDAEREKRILKRMEQNGIGGIIDATSRIDTLEFFEQLDMPIVLLDMISNETAQNVSYVLTDNYASGRVAAEYLVKKGYQKFACIAGPVETAPAAKNRLTGFCDELQEHGRCCEGIYECMFSFDDGYQGMESLLAEKKAGEALAVYACSDIMAWGAVSYCEKHGLEIPKDVAIIGNDNVWCSSYISKGLTTVVNSAKILGEKATNMLLDAIEHEGVFNGQGEVIVPTVCERGTA